ncbi:ABC transporter ATP-binding protein [Pelagibacterium xiamenense]|uniref:ABC transporter ATP-binding protein n=1 Tax=Pelagibacterium xiamenense TaxID=2901140 RepID=UPI001E39542A|nr:ABC transporter ATP-binding protein [Pelagibacterium xiamenense]MCD7061070.1 ABC transporter ATP-binding protein [Pelagibacterium xiamenense]
MSLLRIEGLELTIGDTRILEDIALSLDAGDVLGVVGESGSGKSLTALSIIGLLPEGARLSGRIAIDGREVVGASESALTDLRGDTVGMIFQEPMTALNPLMTIGDQVAETIVVHRRAGWSGARKTAAAVLERVGLPSSQISPDRYPHELSGGQRQRVGIAMAVALKPRLLIADEPTTALDVTTQAQILALLRALARDEEMGLILISHDLAVVAQMADTIAVMQGGRIVEQGESSAIPGRLKHPYSRALFEASTHLPPKRARERGEMLLSVSNVVRDYPLPRRAFWEAKRALRAVDDVTFCIDRGENVGLVGESGCGKSTLARAIVGLETVQSGQIMLAGRPVAGLHNTAFITRRDMQMVFQDPYGSFNPRHKVGRLVAEPLHLLGRDAPDGAARSRSVTNALEQVGLGSADADKFIHEFSGGQRQRIALARALITAPALVVLDEAVSALDVSIRAQILDLLAELSGRLGLSYLFISHDLHVVRAITDRVLVMRAGRIVEAGATETVFASPRHAYTRALIAAAPTFGRA